MAAPLPPTLSSFHAPGSKRHVSDWGAIQDYCGFGKGSDVSLRRLNPAWARMVYGSRRPSHPGSLDRTGFLLQRPLQKAELCDAQCRGWNAKSGGSGSSAKSRDADFICLNVQVNSSSSVRTPRLSVGCDAAQACSVSRMIRLTALCGWQSLLFAGPEFSAKIRRNRLRFHYAPHLNISTRVKRKSRAKIARPYSNIPCNSHEDVQNPQRRMPRRWIRF